MATPRLKRRSPLLRLLTIAAALFCSWHVFASLLWIAPYSPAREVVPGKALSTYMIPMFGQSWSVFAPEPINGDYRLQVRAVTEIDGETAETPWVDATEVELSMIQYNLFPPRAGITSLEVASQLKGAYDKLTADHKVIAGLNYFKDDWSDRLETKMKSYGEPALVDTFITKDAQAVAYATQVAYAAWGENNVARVQYHVTRQNVVPFAKRHDTDAERPAVQHVETGWRGELVRDGQNSDEFAKVFVRQAERALGPEWTSR